MAIRGKIIFGLFLLAITLIIYKLFYWQVILGDSLKSQAESQYFETLEIPASRGEIITSDGFPLVSNLPSFLLFAETKKINDQNFSSKIAHILEVPSASISAKIKPDLYWVALARKVPSDKIDQVKQLNLSGLGWSMESSRYYPEASAAAQLTGFVGSDVNGNDKGYFGLEGFYDLDLKGRTGKIQEEKDIRGAPILIGGRTEESAQNGKTLGLYLDRGIQFIVQRKLEESMEKYGAKQGSVVVMDPKTGGILAMASLPSYDQLKFNQFPQEDYKNPVVADSYEPGSTFKTIIVSAAIDSGLIKPLDTYQDDGSIRIGEYSIKTWNDQYHGKETIIQIIERSCNTGMVWIGKQLGREKMIDYLTKFGFGQKTGIDLEEEADPPFRVKNDWKEIDLATASFGQGIAVTPIQMLQAVGAIANQGKLMQPHIVAFLQDDNGKRTEIKPKLVRQVIKPQTAEAMKEIMVSAVENGEAKWARPKGFRVAGKTGTAQVPVAGHYDKERTIASFVGFAPADNPKFVMLVRLTDTTSSPWAAETAAPLFFNISKELFSYLSIPSNE